jgi:hypothetical protein
VLDLRPVLIHAPEAGVQSEPVWWEAPGGSAAESRPGGAPVRAREAVGCRGPVAIGIVVAALLAGCGGSDQAGSRPERSTAAPKPESRTGTTPAPPPTPGSRWSYSKLVRKLAGRTLTMPHGRIRLDRGLLECNGRGAPVRRGGTRRWSRYTCTQTSFRGGVDRDITFDVVIRGPSRLEITSERYGPN